VNGPGGIGESALLVDHTGADAHFVASVSWVRRLAAFGGEQMPGVAPIDKQWRTGGEYPCRLR
jgi:hypothetical protein